MELTLRPMAKGYLPYSVDQRLLLPVDMREWLPEKHLALFILDVVIRSPRDGSASLGDLGALAVRFFSPTGS